LNFINPEPVPPPATFNGSKSSGDVSAVTNRRLKRIKAK